MLACVSQRRPLDQQGGARRLPVASCHFASLTSVAVRTLEHPSRTNARAPTTSPSQKKRASRHNSRSSSWPHSPHYAWIIGLMDAPCNTQRSNGPGPLKGWTCLTALPPTGGAEPPWAAYIAWGLCANQHPLGLHCSHLKAHRV
jgi:hypothetical protein